MGAQVLAELLVVGQNSVAEWALGEGAHHGCCRSVVQVFVVAAQMLAQFGFQTKVLFAKLTHEILDVHVLLHVRFKVTLLAETLVAVVAHERLFTGVDADVVVQIDALIEAFVAVRTFETFFTRVKSFVQRQFTVFVERFVAYLTVQGYIRKVVISSTHYVVGFDFDFVTVNDYLK